MIMIVREYSAIKVCAKNRGESINILISRDAREVVVAHYRTPRVRRRQQRFLAQNHQSLLLSGNGDVASEGHIKIS